MWVDDLRACPEGWYPARTVTEAIRLLATWPIQEVSLDHDIVCQEIVECMGRTSEETFEPVARYIALMNPRPKVHIHTSNYPAGERMAEILGIEYTWPSDD